MKDLKKTEVTKVEHNKHVLGIFKKIFTITNYDVTPAIDVFLYLLLFNKSCCCHNLAW